MSTSCKSTLLNRAITSTTPSLILQSDSGTRNFKLVFEKKGDTLIQIIARDSIYAIAHICYRNSGWTSGPTSVTWVDQSKMVEARIMKLSPQGSPMTLVSRAEPRHQILKGT